jgi:hypothetical protein
MLCWASIRSTGRWAGQTRNAAECIASCFKRTWNRSLSVTPGKAGRPENDQPKSWSVPYFRYFLVARQLETGAVEGVVRPDADGITQRNGPAPFQVGHKGIHATGLSHDGDPGGGTN